MPTSRLLPGQVNTLAIRLNRFPMSEVGGIPGEIFHIGRTEASKRLKAAAAQRHGFVDGVLTGICLVLLSVCSIALLSGFRTKLVWLTSGLVLVLSASYAAQLHVLVNKNWAPVFREYFAFACTNVLLLLIVEFSAAVLRLNKGWSGWTLQALIGLDTLILLAHFFGVPPYPVFVASLHLSNLMILGVLIWLPAISVRAIIRRRELGWAMLFSFSLAVSVPTALSAFGQNSIIAQTQWLGRWPSDFLVLGFLLVLGACSGLRLWQMERERIEANARARAAQSAERQRVAREMHDSIGQWLSLIKLRLQTLLAETSLRERFGDRLLEVVIDVSTLIEDTRRISHDLSPALIAQKGFEAAVRDLRTIENGRSGKATANAKWTNASDH
ncbi:MAG: hypothetical protein K0U61_13070 [Alphaproteobacteria bacterium]|nr:hypothetical protein [Alphaproteobacteria bacterium]